LQNRSCMMSN